MIPRAGFGWRRALQVRLSSTKAKVLDGDLPTRLLKFVDGSIEGNETFRLLEQATTSQIDRNFIAAVSDFPFKKHGLPIAGYRSQLLKKCGFDVTPTKQPRPVLDLQKVAQIAAAVAGSRGLSLEEFKEEFGLVEQEAENVEDEIEATDTAVEAPAAQEEYGEVMDEPAEGEEEGNQDLGIEPQELDEEELVEESKVEERQAPLPAAQTEDKTHLKRLEEAAPDDRSRELSGMLARGLTCSPQDNSFEGVDDSSTTPQASSDTQTASRQGIVEIPGLHALLDFPQTSLSSRHARAAVELFDALDHEIHIRRTTSVDDYTRPSALLREAMRELANARLANQGGSAFAGDRKLEELYDFGVYFSRVIEQREDPETLTLNTRRIPVIESTRGKRARFPPATAEQRQLLAQLSQSADRDAASFQELLDGVRPLAANLVAVVAGQLRRAAAAPPAAVDSDPVTAPAPPPPPRVPPPTSCFSDSANVIKAPVLHDRIPHVRIVQLTKMVESASGTWFGSSTTSSEEVTFNVLGTRVQGARSLELKKGEVMWRCGEVEVKMQPFWGRGRTSRLEKVVWVSSLDGSIVMRWSRESQREHHPPAARLERRPQEQTAAEGDEGSREDGDAFTLYRETTDTPPPRRSRAQITSRNVPKPPSS